MLIDFIAGIIVGAALIAGGFFLYRFLRRRALTRAFQQSVYLVRIPKQARAEGRDVNAEINLTEQLLANLSALRAPVTFEVVVPHVGEEIHFYIAVPKVASEVMMKQVQG